MTNGVGKQKVVKLKRWKNTVTGCGMYGKKSENNFCKIIMKKCNERKKSNS